jgi:hypothetical protein
MGSTYQPYDSQYQYQGGGGMYSHLQDNGSIGSMSRLSASVSGLPQDNGVDDSDLFPPLTQQRNVKASPLTAALSNTLSRGRSASQQSSQQGSDQSPTVSQQQQRERNRSLSAK